MTRDMIRMGRWLVVLVLVAAALDAAALDGNLMAGAFYLLLGLVVRP